MGSPPAGSSPDPHADDSTVGARIARRITARWWAGVIALVAILGAGAVIGMVGQAERTPEAVDQLAIGSDSRAAAVLAEQLPDASSNTAVMVFTRDSGIAPAELGALKQKVSSLEGAGPDTQVIPSEDGSAAIAILEVDAPDNESNKQAVVDLRAALDEGLPQGMVAQVTGPAAVQADLGAVFDGANTRLLIATASVVAFLLIVTYRSPVLFLVPLTVVGAADQLAAVVASYLLEATGVAWDESTMGILSVLVFGAGTNYSLLIISRYRDELKRTEDRREAMATALRRTTEAILMTSSTVFLGLVTLLLSAIPATRGLGLACAVGVIVAAIYVLIVLPAALVVFGRWIFWPKAPRVGEASLADSSTTVWSRIGAAVARKPAAYILVTVALLGIAGFGATRIDTGLRDADQFLETPESIVASERLSRSFPAGLIDPVRVVTKADVGQVTRAIDGVEGVESVRPGASDAASGVSQVSVVITAAPDSDEARQTIRDIRGAVSGLESTHVTGTEAQKLDQTDALATDRVTIAATLLGLILLALILLFRSLVAPLVLVSTVVLTYLSALGFAWLGFTQFGLFERLDPLVPIYAFVFLVALGIDYNIFLVTRAKEEATRHGTRAGILRALSATGGVITSAGILLAAVFAVLGVLPLVVLAQLGVVICIGVLLDTLVVRTVLVPAIALVLGERFWWPRRISPTVGESSPDMS